MNMLKLSLSAVGAALFAMSQAANAGIDGSPHDLAGSATNDNGEICVYCHTPHGANTNAPLWNKSASGASYTQYNSTFSATIDATVDAVGSISLACLSCHDGAQARDVVSNAPGQGSGSGDMGSGGVGNRIDSAAMTNDLAKIGADLQNDHPVSIQYAGAYGATAAVDTDFKSAQNSGDQFWVDTSAGSPGTREKTDLILYARGDSIPRVECGSCHDPHNTNPGDGTNPAYPNGAIDVDFLRISNQNSAVCLACHDK